MRVNERVREFARRYVQAGLSVVPIKTDGSKAPPPISWKLWQRRRPSPYEIGQFFRNDVGVAILGGAVSGQLEILDFDRASLVDPWIGIVEEKAPGLVARLPRIRTPKGGSHFFYRCDLIEGNEKLAQEPPAIDQATGEPVPNTLIETRGEGGYVVAPGSPPECHPRKIPYEHVAGPPLTEIPRITIEERAVLLDAARSFNKWTPEIVDHRQSRFVLDGDRTRPGDDYNARASWQDVLGPAGWTVAQSHGEIVHWRRPGKTDRGTSATTGHCGDCLYVFSSNAAPFSPGTGYTKFCAYALINHGGDFSAAATALEAAGYGNLEAARAEVEAFGRASREGHESPPSSGNGHAEDSPPSIDLATPQKDYAKKKQKKRDRGEYFDGREFLPEPLANDVVSRHRLIATPIGDGTALGVRVHVYQNGVFLRGGEKVIGPEVRAALQERYKDARYNDVVKNIRMSTAVDFDKLNTRARELINVQNGMLEWRTGRLLPHDPSYLSTIQIAAQYDPSAKSDILDEFLKSILPDDDVKTVEEFIGYLLTPDTSLGKCLIAVGEGGGGKTTFLELVNGLLGDCNVSKYSLLQISEEKFSRSGLFGSLANFYDELETKRIKDTSTFKIIVTGSPLKAEDKGLPTFSFRPFCRLVFATNDIPHADDRSSAYFDRFVIVRFPNRIRGTRKEIREYWKTLLAAPGLKASLLNRAVEGLKRIDQANKFSVSAESVAALDDYRRECNSAYDFVQECCTFDDPTGWMSRRAIYDRYRAWCGDNTRKPMSSKGFVKALKSLNVRETRHADGDGWIGISWRNGSPPITSKSEVEGFGQKIDDETGDSDF